MFSPKHQQAIGAAIDVIWGGQFQWTPVSFNGARSSVVSTSQLKTATVNSAQVMWVATCQVYLLRMG